MIGECWEWMGARNRDGYGNKAIKRRSYLTHRLAYEWANGPIPAGMNVLHRCDNPPCCNPDHLFLGTQSDNVRDMAAKGRHQSQQKTHCKNGHPFDGVEGGHRICISCRSAGKKQASARWRARQRHAEHSRPAV